MSPKVLSLSLMLALLSLGAHAQTIYRIVGADGKVTFSDRAPDATTNPAQTTSVTPRSSSAGGAGLPFELGKVAARFPVTLYTGKNCAPCDMARRMLETRGIPFAERTINTQEDQQALIKLGSDSSLPFATIGAQQLSGFSDAEWNSYLDAAGYPKTSQLPGNYRRPVATPLTQPKPTPAAVDAAPPATETVRRLARPPAPVSNPNPNTITNAPNPNNPAGIKF